MTKERKSSRLEEMFDYQLRVLGFPEMDKEVLFHPKRKWRIDRAYTQYKLGFEIEGGIWINGAHNRGAHFMSDAEKYNEAALHGWTIFRFGPDHIKKGYAYQIVERALILKEATLKVRVHVPKTF